MPKLIRLGRTFGRLNRRLVTDAGGAPCCCQGVCCDQSLPCVDARLVRCADGRYARGLCRQARGLEERFTLQFAYRLVQTSSNGSSIDYAVSATFTGTICRSAPSFGVGVFTPLVLSGFESYRESGPGFAFTQEDGGEVYGDQAISTFFWPLQTLVGGPRRVLAVTTDLIARDRVLAFGAGVLLVGAVQPGTLLQAPIGLECVGTRSSEGPGFTFNRSWAANDDCGEAVAITAAFRNTSTDTRGGITSNTLEFGESILTGTRRWCSCDGDTSPQSIGGCVGCGDASLLQIL